MSAQMPSAETSTQLEIVLPPLVPGLTLRVLAASVERLGSASKERSAAAHLLVRLCIRHDMQRLGLLNTLVNWALSRISIASDDQADIHQYLGVLSFLSGLVASASNEEVGPFMAAIYSSCQRIIDQENLNFIKSSAVARKLIIKILRNVILHCLQALI